MKSAASLISFLCLLSTPFIEAGVKQCYYCDGSCGSQMDVYDCDKLGPGDWKCGMEKLHETLNLNGFDLEFRGCMQVTNQMRADCEKNNGGVKGVCKICDSDVCNLYYNAPKDVSAGSGAESLFQVLHSLLVATTLCVLFRK